MSPTCAAYLPSTSALSIRKPADRRLRQSELPSAVTASGVIGALTSAIAKFALTVPLTLPSRLLACRRAVPGLNPSKRAVGTAVERAPIQMRIEGQLGQRPAHERRIGQGARSRPASSRRSTAGGPSCAARRLTDVRGRLPATSNAAVDPAVVRRLRRARRFQRGAETVQVESATAPRAAYEMRRGARSNSRWCPARCVRLRRWTD